jgi:hypothetical protein
VAVTGTGQWKTADFRLPDCSFMNRGNGADLRLVVSGQERELAVSRVDLQKAD